MWYKEDSSGIMKHWHSWEWTYFESTKINLCCIVRNLILGVSVSHLLGSRWLHWHYASVAGFWVNGKSEGVIYAETPCITKQSSWLRTAFYSGNLEYNIIKIRDNLFSIFHSHCIVKMVEHLWNYECNMLCFSKLKCHDDEGNEISTRSIRKDLKSNTFWWACSNLELYLNQHFGLTN